MVVFLCDLATFTSEFVFLRQWHIHMMTNTIRAPSLQNVHELNKGISCVLVKTVRYFALQVLDSQHGNGQLLVKAYRRHAESKANTV